MRQDMPSGKTQEATPKRVLQDPSQSAKLRRLFAFERQRLAQDVRGDGAEPRDLDPRVLETLQARAIASLGPRKR